MCYTNDNSQFLHSNVTAILCAIFNLFFTFSVFPIFRFFFVLVSKCVPSMETKIQYFLKALATSSGFIWSDGHLKGQGSFSLLRIFPVGTEACSLPIAILSMKILTGL